MTKHRLGSNKNQGSKWLTKKKRAAIYVRDERRCVWCGAIDSLELPLQLTVDHLIPRSRGGCNHPANLVTACLSCNSARSDRSLSDWLCSPQCGFPGSVMVRLAAAIDRSHFVPGFHRPRKTKL